MLGYVLIANVLTSGYNFQKGSILLGYLDGKGGSGEDSSGIIVKNVEDSEISKFVEKNKYTSLFKIASADSNFIAGLDNNNNSDQENLSNVGKSSNPEEENNENIPFVLVQDNYLVSPASYYDETLADLKYGIVKYKVQAGDTPSSIATSFGISTYTVLWVNNLKVGDYIKPGQELEILPVTGIKHIIKANDNIKDIAKSYKADEEVIIAFNNLPADGSLGEGSEGKVIIVPDGEKEAPVKPAPQIANNASKLVSSSKFKRQTNLNPQNGHRFPYGYCTWYAASKIYVPWGGHAKSWLANARAYGYETGKIPLAGSIVVTTENRWYGHVAYVESVSGNSITISEMNYVGWGRTSVRAISINSPVIRGYIYLN